MATNAVIHHLLVKLLIGGFLLTLDIPLVIDFDFGQVCTTKSHTYEDQFTLSNRKMASYRESGILGGHDRVGSGHLPFIITTKVDVSHGLLSYNMNSITDGAFTKSVIDEFF